MDDYCPNCGRRMYLSVEEYYYCPNCEDDEEEREDEHNG